MTNSLSLEAFDADAPPDEPSSNALQAYDDGFAAGFATSQSETASLTAELVQSIADHQFTYSEARGEVLRSVSSLLETITHKVLPHCAAAGFATELLTIIQDAALRDPANPISVTVHPNRYYDFKSLLAQNISNVTVLQDADLSENAAWIGQGMTEHHFNLDQILGEITKILEGIEHNEMRNSSYG